MSNVIPPNAGVAGFGNAAAAGRKNPATGRDPSKAAAVANSAKSLVHESDFEDFPKIDVIQLIKLITEVSKGDKSKEEAAKEFGLPYMAFAKVFVVNKSHEVLNIGLEKAGFIDQEERSASQSDTKTQNKGTSKKVDRSPAEKPKAKTTTKAESAAKYTASTQTKANAGVNTASKSRSKGTAASSEERTSRLEGQAFKSENKATKSKGQTINSEDQTPNSGIHNIIEGVAKSFIDEVLSATGLEDLKKTGFDEQLIACTTSTAALVKAYMNREISVQVFIDKIGNGQIKDLTMQVLSVSGMDKQIAEQIGVKNLAEIGSMAPNAVAFAALTAAYKMVRQAEEEMQIARERRIEIEAACNESIALIRQYRQEMEYVVNNYLTERLETFEKGFEAMDKAILEDDTNGYIKGNAAIQEILGYKAQFTSQEEFDDLMDSDIAFKL